MKGKGKGLLQSGSAISMQPKKLHFGGNSPIAIKRNRTYSVKNRKQMKQDTTLTPPPRSRELADLIDESQYFVYGYMYLP